MKIIVCMDERGGFCFFGKRQSRDKAVIEIILTTVKQKRLFMNKYSSALFEDISNLVVREDFLDAAEKDDYCFVENTDFSHFKEKTDTVIIFCWNRAYPYDKKITEDFLKDFALKEKNEFKGNSHDKITKEIYVK